MIPAPDGALRATSPERRVSFPAVGLVAGIYVHFLLFAQFGFLRGIRQAGHSTETIHAVLGAMALAGLTATPLSAAACRRFDVRLVIATGLVLSAAAAALAALAFAGMRSHIPILVLISCLTGAGLGMATVAAAVRLRPLTGGNRVATHAGLGTGLAYLFCNVPGIFNARPEAQAAIGALAAVIALASSVTGRERVDASSAAQYSHLARPALVLLATIGFLALVWFDSAAFAALQNSPEAQARFWSGEPTLWTIGGAHALAAVFGGAWIDRGGLRPALAVSMGLLWVGNIAFSHADWKWGAFWTAPAYATGVSIYSTALASFAALGPPAGAVPPRWRAAAVYAAAGWFGSTAGVGLAEQFGVVPSWAAPTGALILAVALLAMSDRRRSREATARCTSP